ncbi:ABC transporter permease [Thermoanaerobacter thermohydrosulfuricus]
MRHILAAAKSEFLILSRYPLNLFYNIIAALFSLLPLFYIAKIYNVEQAQYLWILSGSLFWMYISQALWTIGLSLRKEQEMGTLEQILMSPSNLIYIMLGKSIVTVGINSLTLLVGLLLIRYVFDCRINYALTVVVILISMPSVFGFSYIISGIVLKFKEIFAFLQVISGVLLIFSGVSQPATFLPYNLGKLSRFIVFEKMIYTFRRVVIDSASFLAIYSQLIYIFIYGFVLNIIAVFVFYYFKKKVMKNGDVFYV